MEELNLLINKLNKYEEEMYIIKNTNNLLYFDNHTKMPKDEETFRITSMSYFSMKSHELLVAEIFVNLIDELLIDKNYNNLKPFDKIKVDKYKKEIVKNLKLSSEFVKKFEDMKSNAYISWIKSRDENDISFFNSNFKDLLKLVKQRVSFLETDELKGYDVLLDEYEEGMRASELKIIFDDLKPKLINLFNKVKNSEKFKNKNNVFEGKNFSNEKQVEALDELYNLMIKDKNKNKFTWAQTVHPFMSRISGNDVRICTSIRDVSPMFSFLSSAHECGHALHEFGFNKEFNNSILMDSSSFGMHESHSRFWENHVMTSKNFWEGFYGKYSQIFDEELKNISLDDFYNTINEVNGSLIRIEGDEITYGLHIIIRFEIEIGLLDGSILIDDLEDIWKSKYEEYFGYSANDLKSGVLQDVHWSEGLFGYFPTYILGSIYASMYDEELKSVKGVSDEIRELDFSKVKGFLDYNLSKCANTKLTKDIVMEVTGKELDVDCYVRYLENKFSKIYDF